MWGTDRKICHLGSVWHHSACLVMPDSNSQDRFFYLPVTPMIGSCSILQTNSAINWWYFMWQLIWAFTACICPKTGFHVAQSILPALAFANSLDPDQARQNIGTDLDPHCLTLMIFLKDLFEKVNLKKKSTDDKKACKITQHAKS